MSEAVRPKAFYRTAVGKTERTIGVVILFFLGGIGAAIGYWGNNYDPTRYTGDPSALETTRQTVEGKSGTLRGENDLRASEAFAITAANRLDDPSLDTRANSGPLPVTDGLAAMGNLERYNADTLYEKINGRAPAYFEFNFQELTCRSFSVSGQTGQFLDVYLYRMDTPLNAFGIFSMERDPGGQPVDFALDGYRSEMGYFLRVGNIYVQLLASSPDAPVMATAEAYARLLVHQLPANDLGLEGRQLLPPEGQIPGSLTYINSNAYGQEVLSNVFEARYGPPGSEVTYFAQANSDAPTALANWNRLRDFFAKYGRLDESPTWPGVDSFVSESYGQWYVIYVRDRFVAGVVTAPTREMALEFVRNQVTSTPTSKPSPPPVVEEYPYF